MEQYVKVIKKRMLWLKVGMAGMVVLEGCQEFFLPQELNRVADFSHGVLLGLALMALFWLIRYRKVLQSEMLLRQEYNREQDERMQAIRAKAGVPFVLFTSGAMLLVGCMIGYFNDTVFCTLIAAAVLQLLVSGFVKIYFQKTM